MINTGLFLRLPLFLVVNQKRGKTPHYVRGSPKLNVLTYRGTSFSDPPQIAFTIERVTPLAPLHESKQIHRSIRHSSFVHINDHDILNLE